MIDSERNQAWNTMRNRQRRWSSLHRPGERPEL